MSRNSRLRKWVYGLQGLNSKMCNLVQRRAPFRSTVIHFHSLLLRLPGINSKLQNRRGRDTTRCPSPVINLDSSDPSDGPFGSLRPLETLLSGCFPLGVPGEENGEASPVGGHAGVPRGAAEVPRVHLSLGLSKSFSLFPGFRFQQTFQTAPPRKPDVQ